MKTRLLAISLGLPFLTLTACKRDEKAPIEEEKKRVANEAARDIPLMPVNTGDQWIYQVKVEVPAGPNVPEPITNQHERVRTFLGKIAPHEGLPATDCFEVSAPNTPAEREFVEIHPDKILLRGSSFVTEKPTRPAWYDPAVPFVQAGAEPGSKGLAIQSDKLALSRKIQIVAREDVKVPAGTFPSIRLLMVGTDGSVEMRRTIWFAPGTGIVREEKTRYQGDRLLYRETQELSQVKRSGD